MNRKRIAIVGGGLSGLYAAYLLEQNGISDYLLLEARNTLGGRIMDFADESDNQLHRFDLGPTWFWPDFQPQLDALISQLGLQRFAQYEQGNMVVERSPNEAPVIMRGFTSAPASMRLKGGMGELIRALSSRLNNKQVHLASEVQTIRNEDGNITISYRDHQQDSEHTVLVEHVFLGLPPRLAVNRIQFIPALPGKVAEQWQDTPTWMAAHAKYIAVYEKPFWREQGLSGDARSARGPMVEIHDASMHDGRAALFGFLGVPATNRRNISNEEMKVHCRAQMARLFGDQAALPDADIIKDWAQDTFTATEFDLQMSNEHSRAPEMAISTGAWQQRLTGIGSEWSVQFPGYVAGAIEAAGEGVEYYLALHNAQQGVAIND